MVHTSMAHQVSDGCNEQGQPFFGGKADFIPSRSISAFLADMDCENITGHAEKFNTLAQAVSTIF